MINNPQIIDKETLDKAIKAVEGGSNKKMFHCFFEQSGTFKNEFKKLGYEALDYDIQDKFGETDRVIDLFVDIENAYENKESIFDDIEKMIR